MKQQFHLGDSFIDLSRNQITRLEQTETLPPKAMAVLAYLAERQGQVVTIDELLDHVWSGTVVSPNTLQRGIAQLRKALGDDSKTQSIIQTHAKKGYSLEIPLQYSRQSKPSVVDSSKVNRLIAVISGFIAVLILGFANWPQSPSNISFNQMRSLTATDAKEADASYSPDGRFVIFHRFAGLCANNIWAKDIKTGEETQLTDKFGIYSGHSFSPDGKQLVFRARETCLNPQQRQNRQCWHLMTLNLEAAFESPKMPQLMVSCQGNRIGDPKWMSNGNIALMQYIDNQWHVVSYEPGDADYSILYKPADSQPYAMDYSKALDRFAVLTLNNDGSHQLLLLDSTGQLISSNDIEKPELFGDLNRLNLSFHPQLPKLLFSVSKRVYALSENGQIEPLSHQVNHQIFEPKLHASGKKLIATYGIFDHDIAEIDLDGNDVDQKSTGFNQAKTPYPSMQRSILDDNDARFSPKGDAIAFVSERSGDYQLWLANGSSSQQLSQFDTPTRINGYDWHPNEQSIIVAKGTELFQVFINGDTKALAFAHPVIRVHHWYQNNQLLLSAMIDGQSALISWQLDNNQIDIHSNASVFDASVTANGEVIYLDENKRFWQKDQQGLKPIAALSDIQAAKHYAHQGNKIFAIDNKRQVFSYDVVSQSLKHHRKLEQYVSYLSDIKGQQLLLTQTIAVKKEVVELTP